MASENLSWVNSLRVLGTISVIVVHATAGILYQYGSISDLHWWIGNVFDSVVRFCVPIFLMISGTLIFSKTYDSIAEYLKKRILRILFPFLFWSAMYVILGVLLRFHGGEYENMSRVVKFIFSSIKYGASYHLWYIYMIIGLYLFFPIIGKWLLNSKKNEIEYFLGIWMLTNFLHLPVINKYIPNIELSYFSGYLGLPVLGYYLSKTTFNFNKKKILYLSSILIGILMTIFGTFYATIYKGSFYVGFYDYLTPNVILVSVGIFLFFKDFVRSNSKVILFFSNYSYGTYLAHVLILMALEKIGLSYNFMSPIIGIPLTSIVCLLISTLVVWVVNKLPFGKYISG